MKIISLLALFLFSTCIRASELNERFLRYVTNPEEVRSNWIATRMAAPVYPRAAQKKSQVGCVLYSFSINSKGRAENIEVVDATLEGIFDRSGSNSIKRYRWKPTEQNSDRVPVKTELMLTFALSYKEIACHVDNT